MNQMTVSENIRPPQHQNVEENPEATTLVNGTAASTIDQNDVDDDLHIRIPIVGFETMEERARFTVFKLRVEHVKLEENWLVFRRYTDFVRLHSKLKDEFPAVNIPLPPKRWLRDNFETAFLEDRMKGLQAFVDSILMLPILTESPLVREFFCLDEPPTYPDNAEESRSLFGNLEESMVMLKHKLSEKDAEIEMLKTELALVTTQRDNNLKATRNCKSCSQRQSLPPNFQLDFSSPIATSSPSIKSQRTLSVGSGSSSSAHLLNINGVKSSTRINGTKITSNKSTSSLNRTDVNKVGSATPCASPSSSIYSTPSPRVRTKSQITELKPTNKTVLREKVL